MKLITKSVLLILLMCMTSLSFGDGARDASGHKRRYPRRRFYTKRINVFDRNAADDLKVPDPEEKENQQEGLKLDNDKAPLMRDVSSGARLPRMPGPQRSDKGDKEDSSSWIVKALLEVDGDDEGSYEEDDTLGEGWGWLARDSGVLGKDNSPDEDEMESAESIELESEEMMILRELLLNEDVEETADRGQSNSNRYDTAGKKMFVDFEEEARKRFEIFKSFDDDPRQKEGSEGENNSRNEKHEIAANMEHDEDLDKSISDRASQNATFLDKYRNLDIAASRVPGGMDEFDNKVQAPPTQKSSIPRFEQPSKFKSAFDSGVESKFKSPFESSFTKAAMPPAGNSDYNPPGLGDRFEPIGGDHAYSPRKVRDFGRIQSGGLPDTIRESKKKLPYSIRQWD